MTGVIGHIPNPTRSDVAALAAASERGGASWLGLADAFWWRDVWVLLEAAAAATTTLTIGPAMTNPYLRHPFHTVSALATLHEAAPGRVFCGIAAGGSEITAAAGMSRADAGERVGALVSLIRAVADGHPLDAESGRTLDLTLPRTEVMVAGRGPTMLRAAGEHADRVLLWAIPSSDIDRTVAVIRRAAERVGRAPAFTWAPLVAHDDVAPRSVGHPAVYAAINTAPGPRGAWGLDDGGVAEIHQALVSGRLDDAIALVPPAAMSDLVLHPDDVDVVVERARALGVSEIAVPGFAAATVEGHLDWAREVERRL